MTPFSESEPLDCEFPECARRLKHPGDGEVFYLFGIKPVAACSLHAPVVDRIGTSGMRILRLGGLALLKRWAPDLAAQVERDATEPEGDEPPQEGRL